ncbi:unnamed protein product [Lampetra fluviatilis]
MGRSAARLLSLLLHLLLHLLLRPESLLLLASVATLWAAARHGPRVTRSSTALPPDLRLPLPPPLRLLPRPLPPVPPRRAAPPHGGAPVPPPSGGAVGGGPAPLPAPPASRGSTRSRGVAVFALQGRREHMEDRFTVAHGGGGDAAGDAGGCAGEAAPRCGRRHRHALYGVFDGHGGEVRARAPPPPPQRPPLNAGPRH